VRGIGAQLGQVRQVDVVVRARSRSHYGLQVLPGDCGVAVVYGKGGRAGGWCRPKKVWSLSASLCKGLSSRNALGPSPWMRTVQVDLCFPQHSREHGSFECVLRVEVRGWCSYTRGSGGSQGTSQRFEGRRTRSTRATRAERNDLEGPLVATKRVVLGGRRALVQ
jgi:hypothetical protein